MQFKALLLASLAAGVLAETTSSVDMSMTSDSSMSTATRASTDSMTSHSSDDHSSSKDHSSSDHSSKDHMSTSVESGYALTTDASGSAIATYTGTDTKKPKTASLASVTSDSHSSSHTSDHSSSTGKSSGSASKSSSFAMATAVPMIGAAAMAGIAFAL